MKRMPMFALSALALVASAGAAVADGDAAGGENPTFRVCKTCHRIGESAKNFVGPELNGVVGRKAGSVPGYNYSDANKNSGVTWDEATLTKYLHQPARGRAGHQDGLPRPHQRPGRRQYHRLSQAVRSRREEDVAAEAQGPASDPSRRTGFHGLAACAAGASSRSMAPISPSAAARIFASASR